MTAAPHDDPTPGSFPAARSGSIPWEDLKTASLASISQLNLPISSHLEEIEQALVEKKRLVLNFPAGSGKSTLVPMWLHHRGFHANGPIIVVQNRVAIAAELAGWVAGQMGEEVGNRVGYLTGTELLL